MACDRYSGGNKKKLTLAISLLGSPEVCLLDEPSSGLDPMARRVMWKLIAAYGQGQSFLLTTHSMEEAEALCTRIGIMTNGELQCVGTSQHLKNKHAAGYVLELVVKEDEDEDEDGEGKEGSAGARASLSALVTHILDWLGTPAAQPVSGAHLDRAFTGDTYIECAHVTLYICVFVLTPLYV